MPAAGGQSRQKAASVGHFDTALVTDSPENEYIKHTALEGLRVAQVRVIFELPLHLIPGALQSNSTPVQLAYIEWFKPFRQPD
jgi:hypothetical protein